MAYVDYGASGMTAGPVWARSADLSPHLDTHSSCSGSNLWCHTFVLAAGMLIRDSDFCVGFQRLHRHGWIKN